MTKTTYATGEAILELERPLVGRSWRLLNTNGGCPPASYEVDTITSMKHAFLVL